MQIFPTILCGGAGSRLWPVSRELHPKPFIRLADGQSLLQKAFLRGANLTGVKEILTVTNRELFFKTQDEYREINRDKHYTSFIWNHSVATNRQLFQLEHKTATSGREQQREPH